MASKSTIDRLSRSIDKLAGEVEMRHGKFEPCECWVLDPKADRAYQPGKRDVVISAAELEARPIPRTRIGIGRVVYVIVYPTDQRGSMAH